MYLFIVLTIKEQVINSSVIHIPLGSASWGMDDFKWISGRTALSNRA